MVQYRHAGNGFVGCQGVPNASVLYYALLRGIKDCISVKFHLNLLASCIQSTAHLLNVWLQ